MALLYGTPPAIGVVEILRRSLLEFADPDVAEADGFALVAVGLQLDGRGVVCFVEGLADVECFAL